MSIFIYLIYLGILNIIFGFIWKWFFVLPIALLFAFLKLDKAIILLKAFGAYLLVSVTALFTLTAIEDGTGWKLLVFPLLGAFVLFMSFAQNMYEQRREANISYDFALRDQIARNEKYDLFIMFGSVALFILILFIPAIAINPITALLLKTIQWIDELPLIGFLIGIGGFIFMLTVIFYGIIMAGGLIGSLFNKFNRNEDVTGINNLEIEEDQEANVNLLGNHDVLAANVDYLSNDNFESGVIFCSKCGNEISGGSNFCKFCGNKLI